MGVKSSSEPVSYRALITVGGFFFIWALRTIVGSHISTSVHIFIILLLINTYYSVSCFSRVHPARTQLQQSIDVVLGLLYISLICSGADIPLFLLSVTIFFIIAAIKYVMGIAQSPYRSLLQRKVLVNLMGAVAVLLTFMLGSRYGFSYSMQGWAVLYAVANVYLLWYRPLYRTPSIQEG